MDNPNALPQLILPEVPDDFNGGVGVDFLRAAFRLLAGTQVVGGNFENAEPFDAAVIQQSIETIKETLIDQKIAQRQVVMDGLNNGEIIVPFQAMPSTNYDINWMFQIPAGNNPTAINVALVEGSKETFQFKVRIDGAGSPYKFIFTVTEIK